MYKILTLVMVLFLFWINIGSTAEVRSASAIQLNHARWSPRNNMYFIKRELGLAVDNNWYYFQHDNSTIVERRFHTDLQHVIAIDLLFAKNTIIDDLHIRLSIGDHLRSDLLLGINDIPKHLTRTNSGLQIRLYINKIDAVKKYHVFLSELAVHIHGKANLIVQKRPFYTIRLLSTNNTSISSSDNNFHTIVQKIFAQNWWYLVLLGLLLTVVWIYKNHIWTIFWFLIAISLYIFGLCVAHADIKGNYYITCGALTLVLFWRSYLLSIRAWLQSHFSVFANAVYRSAGTPYFFAALLNIIFMSVFLMIKLTPIAEQIAIVVYYLLVVGVVCELMKK